MWSVLDVAAVADSLSGRSARVIAGADALTRTVTRALVAVTAEDLRRVESGDLVITTFDALTSCSEDWEQLVDRLGAAGAAGIAIHLDASAALPVDALNAATRSTVPVIVLPGGAGVGDFASAVLDGLLAAQRSRLERIVEVHQRFTRIVLDGGGPVEIAAALRGILECTVAVLDTDGQPIAIAPPDANDVKRLASSPEAHLGVTYPIQAGGHAYGAIVAFTDSLPLDEYQSMALERAAMAAAMRQAHASAVAEAEERFAAISLEELISGHISTAAEIIERAASFGWDLRVPRAVLLASLDPPVSPDSLMRPLATIAAAARATLGRDAIVWTRSTTIAALVAPATDDPVERRTIAERLRHELDERLRTATVSIGVGRRVTDPTELARSFSEASRAVYVGRWIKGRHVTEVFDELGLERLLAAVSPDDLTEFVIDAIGPLIEHDRQHNGELIETLAVWLETRNMAEAARLMHVHYNTLKNRLERVESILGAILADSRRSLECRVAIYVAQHYDGPWRTAR